MANRQKSHFGSDGYKELYAKQEAANRDGRPIKNNMLSKLKDKEYKNKKLSARAGKTIVSPGTGKRNIGEFR